eukprot:scaffold95216_cov68-Attheya_sp.AAC.9
MEHPDYNDHGWNGYMMLTIEEYALVSTTQFVPPQDVGNIYVMPQTYKSTSLTYGQQQQPPMAHTNSTGWPPLGPRWYITSTTPQPSQLINDLDVQYQKQEEKYTQYILCTLNSTIISNTTSTASPMHYKFEDKLDKMIKKNQDSLLDKMIES